MQDWATLAELTRAMIDLAERDDFARVARLDRARRRLLAQAAVRRQADCPSDLAQLLMELQARLSRCMLSRLRTRAALEARLRQTRSISQNV